MSKTLLNIWKIYYDCPDCQSTEVYAGEFGEKDGYAWRLIECYECGRTWCEVFEFSYNEEVEED